MLLLQMCALRAPCALTASSVPSSLLVPAALLPKPQQHPQEQQVKYPIDILQASLNLSKLHEHMILCFSKLIIYIKLQTSASTASQTQPKIQQIAQPEALSALPWTQA